MTKTMYKVVVDRQMCCGTYEVRFGSVYGTNLLDYRLDLKTVPSFGKIFCFKNLNDARRFRDENRFLGILEGQAENPKGIKRVSGTISHDRIFWRLYESKKSKGHLKLMNTPKGTFVCDSFTPMKLIE